MKSDSSTSPLSKQSPKKSEKVRKSPNASVKKTRFFKFSFFPLLHVFTFSSLLRFKFFNSFQLLKNHVFHVGQDFHDSSFQVFSIRSFQPFHHSSFSRFKFFKFLKIQVFQVLYAFTFFQDSSFSTSKFSTRVRCVGCL